MTDTTTLSTGTGPLEVSLYAAWEAVPPEITTSSLPEGEAGADYAASLGASGGTGDYTWSATGLPGGLSLGANSGEINGTPTETGDFAVSVTVEDANGTSASKDLSLHVVAGPSVVTESLPDGEVGVKYSARVEADGGVAPYSWSVSDGALPAGLSLSETGKITGTLNEAGDFDVTVKVTDANAVAAMKKLSVHVVDGPSVITDNLPDGEVGVEYSTALEVSGGVAPYSWSVSDGSLPDGLELAKSGQITGTPTESGEFDVTVAVTDSNGQRARQDLSVRVVAAPMVTTTALPDGEVGLAYSAQLEAKGGTAPYSWSISDGSLPEGLELAKSGEISGVPAEAGDFAVTVKVTDANAVAAKTKLSVHVVATPVVTTTALPGGEVGVAYSAQVEADGGVPPYSWSVSAGALPDGLSVSVSGEISGTPTDAGDFDITVTVTDGNGQTATQELSVHVNAALVVTTDSLPGGTVGESYTAQLEASGGDGGPYDWSVAEGSLPPGLSLASDGTISGTPAEAGKFAFTVAVDDPATAKLSITIEPATAERPPPPQPEPPEQPVPPEDGLPPTGASAGLLPLGLGGLTLLGLGGAMLLSTRRRTRRTAG